MGTDFYAICEDCLSSKRHYHRRHSVPVIHRYAAGNGEIGLEIDQTLLGNKEWVLPESSNTELVHIDEVKQWGLKKKIEYRTRPNGSLYGCMRCQRGDHGDCHGCSCPCSSREVWDTPDVEAIRRVEMNKITWLPSFHSVEYEKNGDYEP